MEVKAPKVMGGYKTWIAVIGTILSGIGIMASGFGLEPTNMGTVVEGFLVVLGGVALLGLGNKVEKIAAIIANILKDFQK